MEENKKSENQRDELYKATWNIANNLRGSVDGWDFKSYVLVTLFYRYISENLTNDINNNQRLSEPNFDYTSISDERALKIKNEIIKRKGFFILPSQLFVNVRKNAAKDNHLNTTLEKVFKSIQDSAKDSSSWDNFNGLFDDFKVTDKRLGNNVETINKKLCLLLDCMGELKLASVDADLIDVFGDIYEYLMSMYASNAGKSGGEFFTPQEVSRLLMLLCIQNKKRVGRVYDPACGSGSLLLQAAKILGKENISGGLWGQEINLTTYNLCRINMFLHDINFSNFHIACGDTLKDPDSKSLKNKYDVIVSNPPYSIRWDGKSDPVLVNDVRFSPSGELAPESRADLAFVMHIVYLLDEGGTAAVVCFPGVLYRLRAEKKIREYLVNNNFVDAIIQLPSNLFFGTSIATYVMVLKKNKKSKDVLFINASDEFQKVGKKNKLSERNIQKIVQAFNERKDIEYFAKLVSFDQIKNEDYNLLTSIYLQSKIVKEEINIDELNCEIARVVENENKLRKEIDEIIAKMINNIRSD